jgi:hypothetical protein
MGDMGMFDLTEQQRVQFTFFWKEITVFTACLHVLLALINDY